MKAKLLTICFIVIAGLYSFSNYAQTQNPGSEKKQKEMLENFYTQYITQVSKAPTHENIEVENLIKKNYVTGRLLNEIQEKFKRGALDFDPFLKAQDCDIQWLKTLSIKSNRTKINCFTVSYIQTPTNNKVNINLIISEVGGNYKISSVR